MPDRINISTGIEGLDSALDYLRPGDTVACAVENISDYMYVATQFVTNIARGGNRIVYLRFGSHPEVVDADALIQSGSNVKKYDMDPGVGFETFSVQVHRIISSEPEGTFYIFDCISELQKFWFSDLMICNFFCLTVPFLKERGSIAYIPLQYEKHIYETASRIRNAAPVLMDIRTVGGYIYILPVKADGRRSDTMFCPLRISGNACQTITSSIESYGIFDIFTQTGERRDCWDTMFDTKPVNKENIMRCLLGTEPEKLDLCRKYFSLQDLMDIKRREIGTGCIGGKSVGMLLSRTIIRDEAPGLYRDHIEPHDSYYIGADVFYTYAVQNNIWELRTKMVEPEDYIRLSPELRDRLLNGSFMQSIKEQFISMLEYFGQSPIIVRSSSLLEDGIGNAFAGKYESVFCPNQGTLEERYEVFEKAVKQVYASTVSQDAYKYRAERNLLDRDEQMALLVMRVCGDRHGDYYYPHVAGVGHSKNLYVNNTSSSTDNKGMVRLVFGMGTRAVDREADDYARLLSMDNPLAPLMVAHGDEYKYSQHKADVINLRTNNFDTVYIESLGKEDLHTDKWLFFEPDYETARRFREDGVNAQAPDILNFSKLLRNTDFTSTLTEAMRIVEEKYSYPVDIEFAANFAADGEYRINLLQCRTLQTHGLGHAGVKPKVKDYYFKIKGNFMGGNVCIPVRYAVFVEVEEYLNLSEQMKYSVARKIGDLNSVLKDTHAILIGPGRWGTTTPSLGVPVSFSDISRYDCICEAAYSSHGLRPELSYGSHFFQDLVESGIFYAALYRDENSCFCNGELFSGCENRFAELLSGNTGGLENVISVYDLGEGEAILYSEIESQECFLARI